MVDKFMLYDGKFLITNDGFAVHEDCCCAAYKLIPCYEETEDCYACAEGTTPAWITVVISGIHLVSECLNMEGVYCYPTSINGVGMAINATFVCAFDNICFGQLDPGSLHYTYWSSPDCSPGEGEAHEANSSTIILRYLEDGSYKWFVEVDANWGGIWGDYFHVFYGIVEGQPESCHIQGVTIPNELSIGVDCTGTAIESHPHWYVASGGTAALWAGDIEGEGRCPGGASIYTNTDLSAYVGKIVEIGNVCYAVYENPDPNPSDGAVNVTNSYDYCEDCCNDT